MRERLITLKPNFLCLSDKDALELILLRRKLRREPPDKVVARKSKTTKSPSTKKAKVKADPLANLHAITVGMTAEQKAAFLASIMNS